VAHTNCDDGWPRRVACLVVQTDPTWLDYARVFAGPLATLLAAVLVVFCAPITFARQRLIDKRVEWNDRMLVALGDLMGAFASLRRAVEAEQLVDTSLSDLSTKVETFERERLRSHAFANDQAVRIVDALAIEISNVSAPWVETGDFPLDGLDGIIERCRSTSKGLAQELRGWTTLWNSTSDSAPQLRIPTLEELAKPRPSTPAVSKNASEGHPRLESGRRPAPSALPASVPFVSVPGDDEETAKTISELRVAARHDTYYAAQRALEVMEYAANGAAARLTEDAIRMGNPPISADDLLRHRPQYADMVRSASIRRHGLSFRRKGGIKLSEAEASTFIDQAQSVVSYFRSLRYRPVSK
jgi:hypothetical protein